MCLVVFIALAGFDFKWGGGGGGLCACVLGGLVGLGVYIINNSARRFAMNYYNSNCSMYNNEEPKPSRFSPFILMVGRYYRARYGTSQHRAFRCMPVFSPKLVLSEVLQQQLFVVVVDVASDVLSTTMVEVYCAERSACWTRFVPVGEKARRYYTQIS